MKVLACLSAFLLFAPVSYGETILLDFSGKYCPPCRQMEPVVAGLEREGYHIERINVELAESKAKMQQYGVDRIPTFIALTDGQETGRLVGAVPVDSLKKLMTPAGQNRNAKANSWKGTEQPVINVAKSDRPTDQSLVQRSVRIVVDDGKSRSFGTGTVVRSVPGETLVLTCAHLFQGASRQAKTTVEFFGAAERPRLGGDVLAKDDKADVCLVRVVSTQVFPATHVASRKSMPVTGQATASVGCDNGADPTVRHMKVTAINRYVGAPTIECSGEPVEGRSGGGLFNEAGDIIGVCSARDPSDHRGIYGGLAAVHALLDQSNLAILYEPKSTVDPTITLAGFDNKKNAPITLPEPNAIGLKVDHDLPIPGEGDAAEVVCVIRSLENPTAPPKVVLLNRATPEFLSLLEKERAAQAARSTSMRLPSQPRTETVATVSPSATPLVHRLRDAVEAVEVELVNDENPEVETADFATRDSSGWRNARADTLRQSKESKPQERRSAVEESAIWQKNWPVGAASSDSPVRR
jgi:thiol-disulfide isomerase/thioredoxin